MVRRILLVTLALMTAACGQDVQAKRSTLLPSVRVVAPVYLAKPKAEFYVAPNGKSKGKGKLKKPWNLATALAHPDVVQPGTTIWLRGGVYTGVFTSSLTGLPDAPIIVRAFPGERVIIDGNTADKNVLTINGAYTWYWGFEVTNSFQSPNAADGVTLGTSKSIKLINLTVHDHGGNGIGAWSQSVDSEIYGCLSFYNGRMAQANHAYGIYGQNEFGEKRIEESIFIHNFGNYPMHIYGSAEAHLDNFRFTGNVFYGGWGLIGGGRRAENPVLDSNYFVGSDVDDGIFDLGWQTQFGPGANNAVLTGNYFINGAVNFNAKNTNTTLTGNTFYGRVRNVDTNQYPDNNYYVADSGPVPRPSGVLVFVRPSKYEAGRANVIVFNWDGEQKAQVDLSNVLRDGDQYEVRDAQDYFGSPVKSGTFHGESITVSLKSDTIGEPRSVPTDRTRPAHTGEEFRVFLVQRVAST